MLEVLANAVREHGTPDTLYLDYAPGSIIVVLFPRPLCSRVPRRPSRVAASYGSAGHITGLTRSRASPGGCGRCATAAFAAVPLYWVAGMRRVLLPSCAG